MSYYERKAATHLDGTPIFRNQEDATAEQRVAIQIEEAWECRLGSFGVLAPLDWYAERQGRFVGVLELKSRSHASDKYPTIWLNLRKWLALSLASAGFGVPAIFVVKFTDVTLWAPIDAIPVQRVEMGGTNRTVKSITDREPVVPIPISCMRPLEQIGG